MALEGQIVDRKSLAVVSGGTADWSELAKDCVCFANAAGGRLLVGIEDDHLDPAPDQRIDPDLLDKVRKRIGELTVNVSVLLQVVTAPNGGEVLEVTVQRALGVASTSDGRYYSRVGDRCLPVTGDDVMRLAADRAALPWETLTTMAVPRTRVDAAKLAAFVDAVRASDRVKASVKEKSPDELLAHYMLAEGDALTNVGVLCLGLQHDRANLGVAPVVQVIKSDERGQRVGKWVWDDYTLAPQELVAAVLEEIPDFHEEYEIPAGMFRTRIPAFDEVVVRELLVNALVHRPYTQRGDIFLNLHPDRLEVVNPGRLPLGVTPQTVLHESRRRNDHLARVFHDLKLMEREGSGFDLMYERLLAQGRPVPVLTEGPDRVSVVVQRRIVRPEVIELLGALDSQFQLTQRERITFGLLAQHEGMTAQALAQALELPSVDAVRPWLGRLLGWKVVLTSGRTRGLQYFVDPSLQRKGRVPTKTTLTRIEAHRLEALVVEDLNRYPGSSVGEIRGRIGEELPAPRIKRALDKLVSEGRVTHEGENRWRRYRLA